MLTNNTYDETGTVDAFSVSLVHVASLFVCRILSFCLIKGYRNIIFDQMQHIFVDT